MIEYIVVALIPEPWCSAIVALRKKYDRWTTTDLPPHITIVRPLHDLPSVLRAKAGSLRYPFQVTFGPWNTFGNPDNNVVWIDPGQAEPRRVADQLYQDFPDLKNFDNGRYQPGKAHIFHITAANHIPDQDFGHVAAAMRQEKISGSFTIERLTVFKNIAEGHWETVA